MKTVSVLAFGTLAVLSTVGVCQTKPKSDTSQTFMNGWGPQSIYNKTYQSGTEATLSGKILGINATRKPANSMSPATSITLLEKGGKVADVHLGPTWFVKNTKPSLTVGDNVKVTGSQVDLSGNHVLLARKVTKGNRVLYLRDVSGYPMWVASHPVVETIVQAPGAANSTGSTGSYSKVLDANGSTEGDSPFGPVALTVYPPEPAAPATTPAPAAGNKTPANGATPPANQAQTFQGTLQNVVHAVNPQTGVSESFMLVNTPQGTMTVDLGPDWFVSQQGVTFNNGSHILVNGQLVPGDAFRYGVSGPAYTANGVHYQDTTQNQVLILRNGNTPVWNPWFPSQ